MHALRDRRPTTQWRRPRPSRAERCNQPAVEYCLSVGCDSPDVISGVLGEPQVPVGTGGKIERFHKTLRVEFDTRQVFRNLKTAQEALDEWVSYYNAQR